MRKYNGGGLAICAYLNFMAPLYDVLVRKGCITTEGSSQIICCISI